MLLSLKSNSNHRRAKRSLVPIVGLCLTWSTSAFAEGKLAFDAEASFPEDAAGVERGWGAGLRIGQQWDFWLLALTPELGAYYHAFRGSADAGALRLIAGGRLSVGAIIEPSAFVHGGVGRLSYSGTSETDLAYDAGLAIDFTLLPVIDFGIHAAWIGVTGPGESNTLSWLALGAHLSLAFGG